MEKRMANATDPASVSGEKLGCEEQRLILLGYGASTMIVPHSRPSIDQSDIAAVSEVLSSGGIAQGEKVMEFENAVARYVGKKYGVAVSSGTSALHLALLGLGIGPGHEVIMPSYVCSSPYFATLHARAVPKIVDIDMSNLNICASTVEPHVSSRTKAIIVPHMFGNPAELDPLLELGIPVIEDCAQSLGAEYKGRRVGSIGELAVFSFYATKMITTGEGGMILTDDEKTHARLVEARDYDKKALSPTKYNYKMTDLQAALGLSQLSKLPSFIERRWSVASLYNEVLSKYGIGLPSALAEKTHVFYRYVVMLERMEQVREKTHKDGIICERPVFEPLHRSLPTLECPDSDRAHEHALSIPLYPSLSQEEIDYLLARLEENLRSSPGSERSKKNG
jgi:dTDP-4-amino-4,6-dideoxygalactose transaminase